MVAALDLSLSESNSRLGQRPNTSEALAANSRTAAADVLAAVDYPLGAVLISNDFLRPCAAPPETQASGGYSIVAEATNHEISESDRAIAEAKTVISGLTPANNPLIPDQREATPLDLLKLARFVDPICDDLSPETGRRLEELTATLETAFASPNYDTL